ncbi:unnamed protein product, partial [marine sediment metagenome]
PADVCVASSWEHRAEGKAKQLSYPDTPAAPPSKKKNPAQLTMF